MAPGPPPAAQTYPLHTGIVSTTFWIGEVFNPSVPDGSQVFSTYDSMWESHYGGCDGLTTSGTCQTEARTAVNGFFPTSMTPKENPFYLDLPYDDLHDPIAFANRDRDVPWANTAPYSAHHGDTGFSYMKNRWVRIVGPTGQVCFGQNEDAGPSHDKLYHDATYVFGSTDARPFQLYFNNAGMDVSPALNGCLGFSQLNGQNDHVTWQFVEATDVPNGPWTTLVTTSGVTP